MAWTRRSLPAHTGMMICCARWRAEVPGVRPPVLSQETRERLDRYRGFRHVVRNVYTYNLDPEQIGVLVKQLAPTMVRVSQESGRVCRLPGADGLGAVSTAPAIRATRAGPSFCKPQTNGVLNRRHPWKE